MRPSLWLTGAALLRRARRLTGTLSLRWNVRADKPGPGPHTRTPDKQDPLLGILTDNMDELLVGCVCIAATGDAKKKYSWWTPLRRGLWSLLASLASLALVLLLAGHLVPLYDDALDPLLEVCYSTISLQAAEAQCLSRTASDMVISLSTLPMRTPYLPRTLKSLLMQTHCPRRIFVWVPRYNQRRHIRYTLPDELVEFNRTSRIVHVRMIDRDYGPATKLIPTLQWFTQGGLEGQRASGPGLPGGWIPPDPQQGIVLLDDDVLYAPDILQRYACFHRMFPEAALGAWGCRFTHTSADSEGSAAASGIPKLNVTRSCTRGTSLQEPMPAHFLYGTASIFIRAGWMNATALAHFAPVPAYTHTAVPVDSAQLALHSYFQDDWLFSLALLASDRVIMIVPESRRQLVQFDTLWAGRGALIQTDNLEHTHFDAMQQATFDMFPDKLNMFNGSTIGAADTRPGKAQLVGSGSGSTTCDFIHKPAAAAAARASTSPMCPFPWPLRISTEK